MMAACGSDTLELTSLLEEQAELLLLLPGEEAQSDCGAEADQRYCAEDFEPLAQFVMEPGARRRIEVEQAPDDCRPVVFARWLRLGEVGPVVDSGTTFELSADVELEYGAGALHSVAFPQGIVRLDEVGFEDRKQFGPPQPCRP